MPLDMTTIPADYFVARKAKEGDNIITPIGRLSWPALFKPERVSDDPDSEKKFSVALLLPPQSDLKLLKELAANTAIAKWGDKTQELLAEGKLRTPFTKVEVSKYPMLSDGWTKINLKSDYKPGILDALVNAGSLVKIKEEDPELVYPGRWAQITVHAYAYEQKGNKGVSFGLNNILLLHHDDLLGGGGIKAESEFEAPRGLTGAVSPNSTAPKPGTIESMF